MFGNFDEFGRPYRRHAVQVSPPSAGQPRDSRLRDSRLRGSQPPDWRQAYLLLQQDYEKAQAAATAWQQEAEKWHAAAQTQRQPPAQLAQLQKQLAAASEATAALKAEKKELEERLTEANGWQEKQLRLYADFENSKKRLAQRYAAATKQEKEQLLRDMLPVVDNLERALAHAAGAEAETGIALTLKALTAVLSQHGVTPIPAQGQPFDPQQHEALGINSEPEQEPGTITAVMEKGYWLDGKLLRPARVLVNAT